MKKVIAVAVMMVVAVSVAGNADTTTKKKHKAKHHSSSNGDVKGGGYYGGKYHIQKAGKPDKLDLKWQGVDNPIKGMKESAKKPPATTPSQSPNP